MKKTRAAWSAERLEQWRLIRASGESRYIWSHGVLRWGGFMFCFSMALHQYSRYGDLFSSEGNLPFRLIFGAAIWVFVGYLYGRSQWRRNEREFAEQTRRV
ncbi:hypothetical protein [Methylococcus sp. EFPC2]|uniref:hypothetical protein n=1 Tax=Methylococcus sp. EFPC2 TaxID=2812648 RepID=UPI0019680C00|nr:hypothetical protein [Methylococcus sp. EFPC2]QSA98446.1 hypothetical protein JWZ97_06460 [Methylococcus sp. EFPC2]